MRGSSLDLRLYLPPEFERAGDPVEALRRSARSAHGDRSESERLSQERLVHDDALDLGEEDLDRLSAEEAGLDQHPLVGDGDLGRVSPEDAREDDGAPGGGQYPAGGHRRLKPAARAGSRHRSD